VTASIDLDSFARRVLRATKNGQISWATSETDSRAFVASAGAGSVRITGVQVDEDTWAIRLEILDSSGRVTNTRDTDPLRSGPWLDWETTLNDLYDAAHFAGSGTSEVLQALNDEWKLPPDPEDEDIPF
jgi:hypothetical protein